MKVCLTRETSQIGLVRKCGTRTMHKLHVNTPQQGLLSNSQRMAVSDKMAATLVKNVLSKNFVAVFSKSFCPFCDRAKDVLKKEGVTNSAILELDLRDDGSEIQAHLTKLTNVSTVPYVFINNQYIGGGTLVQTLSESGKLKEILSAKES